MDSHMLWLGALDQANQNSNINWGGEVVRRVISRPLVEELLAVGNH